MTVSMNERYCLVTGVTSGLGEATARGLAARGAHVILACRDVKRGLVVADSIKMTTGNRNIDILQVDLASLASIRRAVKEFKERYDKLHVLVNCAGINLSERILTEDGFESMLAVNHLAPFLLTHLLLDLLKNSAPSRIINYSSSVQKELDFDDLMSNKNFGLNMYGRTKMANVLFTYELSHRLEGSGVTVNCLHPGVVRTRLGRDMTGMFKLVIRLILPFLLSAAKGAETAVYLASSAEVEGVTGKYFTKKKAVASSKASYDDAAMHKLWEVSTKLVQLN
jgi:NAD(P)-dependent dehydrogenase (short-subunit alcohol dehydrogenase family)